MKKYIIYLFFISLFSVSCTESFIDLEPKDILTDNLAFVSFQDVEASLLGTYATLRSGNYLSTSYTLVPDIIADNARQTSENQGQQVFFHNWQYGADDNAISPIWATIYLMIRRTNTTLEQVDNFEATQAQRDAVRGQSLALRAMGHFDLLRYFTDFNNLSAPGVPIKLIANEVTTPPRATVGEVFTQIEADLAEARTLLQGLSLGDAPHRLTYDAVVALSARVALYKKDYANAITFSTELINSRDLATGEDFETLWTEDDDGDTGEIIFSVSVLPGEGGIGNALFSEVGNPLLFWAPSESLLGLYDEVNDARFARYFKQRADDPTQIVDNKYRGRLLGGTTPPNPGTHDLKTFRLSEQYLIRAEARARSNDNAGGSADLNSLRAARITDYENENLTGNTLLNSIEVERRRELAFEGHRWFDLRRNNQSIVRGAECDNSPAVNCTLEAGNFRFIFPIPQDEVFANDNMVQNPGYSD